MKDTIWQQFIHSNPKILFGKPVIRGTRIPVDLILEKLGAGESLGQLLKAYPSISKDAILACLTFAAEAIKNDIILPGA